MVYDIKKHYLCSSVKEKIYNNTTFKTVDDKDVYEFAKYFGVHVETTIFKRRVVCVYPRYEIDALFATKEKRAEVEKFFDVLYNSKSLNIIKSNQEKINNRIENNNFDDGEYRENKMRKYISSHQDEQHEIPDDYSGYESDMDYISKKLIDEE